MKSAAVVVAALLAAPVLLNAQARAPKPAPSAPAAPPPIYPVQTVEAVPAPAYVYDQKPIGGRPYLITPEQAQSIINRFKDEYKKIGAPRMIIYVNRDLIDETSGVKLTSHKRIVEAMRTNGPGTTAQPEAGDAVRKTERVASTNIYRAKERKESTLADKQTVRDIERLFGRPLRMAGVQLADQRIANQLANSAAIESFAVQPDSEQARKEREALAKVADVVLEVLVSSKDVPVAELGGDRTYTAPDIQATAIRLSDSRILGQATAADLIGQGPAAGRAVRNFGIREIAEATVLSLMEDMMLQ